VVTLKLRGDRAAAAPGEIWAPLGVPGWMARLPGRVGAFAQRRVIEGATVTAPWMIAVEAGMRAWARDATDRRYLAEFALRHVIDRWAAREVERRRPPVVIAPSLAARRTFAAARAYGATTILAMDLPLFRTLHRDLDRAAVVWPERAFLRRFRAPSWAIAAQDSERVLADAILVRGAYARMACVADGIAETKLQEMALPPPRPMVRAARPTGRVRLAGLAAARHGVDTALAAADALGLSLVVRVGDGTEPADLATRTGVAVDDGPVDAVICPAVCETYADELRAARAAGVPVIASPGASADGRGPDPFDAIAFAAAIEAALEPLS
jgi:hypothetical protein